MEYLLIAGVGAVVVYMVVSCVCGLIREIRKPWL